MEVAIHSLSRPFIQLIVTVNQMRNMKQQKFETIDFCLCAFVTQPVLGLPKIQKYSDFFSVQNICYKCLDICLHHSFINVGFSYGNGIFGFPDHLHLAFVLFLVGVTSTTKSNHSFALKTFSKAEPFCTISFAFNLGEK